MNKLFQAISVFTIIAANLLLLIGLYWLLYPYKTVDFPNIPFPVVEREIVAGNSLTYVAQYCKHSSINPLISRYFKDGILYIIPDIIAANNKMGCNTNKVVTTVPVNLPPGEYTMEIVYHYQVNPIRTINVVARTEPFLITGGE